MPDSGDDVRRMAAARTFGVEGVDGAVLEGGQRVLEEAAFVQRIGVDRDLDIHLVGHRQAVVDRGRRRAPVLMQFQADRAGTYLFFQRQRQADIALAEEAQIHRESVGRGQHRMNVPRARRAGGGRGAYRRTGATTDHRGHARHQRFLDLLRADEMDVCVDATGGDDVAFAGDDLGRAADRHRHIGLDVRIAGLADGGDASTLDADVGLHDSPVVEDDRIRDHGVHHILVRQLRLAHAVADHLATAELHLFAVAGVVPLDLDEQLGVGQPDAVARGRAEHFGIGLAGDLAHAAVPFFDACFASFSLPITWPLKP